MISFWSDSTVFSRSATSTVFSSFLWISSWIFCSTSARNKCTGNINSDMSKTFAETTFKHSELKEKTSGWFGLQGAASFSRPPPSHAGSRIWVRTKKFFEEDPSHCPAQWISVVFLNYIICFSLITTVIAVSAFCFLCWHITNIYQAKTKILGNWEQKDLICSIRSFCSVTKDFFFYQFLFGKCLLGTSGLLHF